MPKIPFSLTSVTSGQISFRIGDDPGSYSCTRVSGISHGYISSGGNSKYDLQVWCFEYDPLPWYGVVTDQKLIAKISNQEKGYWMPSLIKATLLIAADADQLLYLVQQTIKMAEKSAYDRGRKDQAQSIVESLGLDKSLVKL